MRILTTLLTFTILSLQAVADETSYQKLLAEHAISGHLAKHEVLGQEYKGVQNKHTLSNLGRAVRSVASTASERLDTLKFTNPEIEISTK